ncbi:MAG: hypothetical protein AB8B55_21815, partial [Mariniblastus sp.]
MPRKKTLAYVFLGLMVLSGVALFSGVQYLKYQFFNADPNTLTFNGELHSIPFEWVEVQFGDHVEPHYAMNVQVTIPGIPNKFYMQFDTGSPYTFFRSGAMDELRSHGADFELFERDDNTFVKKIELNIAANRVVLNSGKVNVRGATIDWDDPLAINIIGTIGADFLASKVVAIDFPAKRISLFEGRTPSLESLGGFTSFSFEGRRI